MRRAYRVLIVPPTGKAIDVTQRVSDLGSITESLEDSLLTLSHSSLSLTIADRGGTLWKTLGVADPDDSWELIVHRTTGRRRPRWERVFGGVLDLPWSVSRELSGDDIEVEAFSFSKRLERVSAEGVRRSFGSIAATIASGSTSMTSVTSTTGMQRNDIIILDNGTGTTETFTVAQVTGSTTLTTKAVASNSFSAASVTVTTPYLRDVSPDSVVTQLLTLAAIDSAPIRVADDVAPYPVPTPLSEAGSRGFSVGRSLTTRAGAIEWTGNTSPRQTTTGPTAAWTDTTATAIGVFDWTPYYTTEPGAIKSMSVAGPDIGLWVTRYGSVSARRYTVVGNATTMTIEDDLAATLATMDTVASGGYSFAYIEYDPVNDGMWMSYKRADNTREALEYYDFTTTAQIDIDVAAGIGGRIRCCRALNAMIVHAGATLRVYDLTTKALRTVATVPVEARKLAMWTLRAFDGFVSITGQNQYGQGSFVYFWTTAWQYVKGYELIARDQGLGSGTTAGLLPNCVPYTFADGHQALIVDAFGSMLVLSRKYDGVIPYADADGKSCGALLAEIAAVMLRTFDVTPYGVARMRPRLISAQPIATLDDALEGDEQPLWDDYRASFAVTGKDTAGVDIEYVSGDTGDSARRGSRSVDIAVSMGMAQTIAESAGSFFSAKRLQVDGTWAEGRRRVRPFDVVTYRGRKWLALESELDLADEEQDLRLVSVV